MNYRSLTTIFSLLAFTILFTTCSSGGVTTGTGEKITLQLKLEKGQEHKQMMSTVQKISQEVMGRSQTIDQEIAMYFSQKVTDVKENGNLVFDVKYTRVKMKQSSAVLENIDYDSDRDESAPAMAIGFKGLVNNGFGMEMDKQGHVVEVSGVDAMYDRMMDVVSESGAGAAITKEMREKLRKSFGPEAMKRSMQQMATILPDVQVGKGATWGAKTRLPGEYPLAMETDYEIVLIDGDKCVIKVDGTIETEGDATMEIGGITIEYNLAGTQSGTMEVNRKTGMVDRSQLTQDISGSMRLMGTNVPMTIKSDITISPF